jgi:hypothetical protein
MGLVKFKDGDKEVELKVKRPTVPQQKEAEKIYRKAFKAALDNGDYLRVTLDDRLRKAGLWNDDKQAEYNLLVAQVIDTERKLAQSHMKLSEARKLVDENLERRGKLQDLIAGRIHLDSVTAEAQGENEKFNYLVSACTVYSNNDKPYFKSYEDYLANATGEAAVLAATELAKMLHNYDENADKNLPEYKFLKKWGFVDEKLRYIKDGKLVDKDGRPVDEEGNYINEKGERVDRDGNPLDSDGNWKVEEEVFYDDDGNPITPPTPAATMAEPKTEGDSTPETPKTE